MVEVGSVSIGGGIETSEIEQGFTRIKGGFQQMKGEAESSNASFERLGKTSAAFGKDLLRIGTVGVAALTGLATISPAVAPELAKMRVQMIGIANVAGQQLKPVFESIASGLLPAIGTALQNNQGIIESFSAAVSKSITDVGALISGEGGTGQIATILGGGAGAVVGGSVGGVKGAIAGAGIGSTLANLVAPKTISEQNKRFGVFAETFQASQDFPIFDEKFEKPPNLFNAFRIGLTGIFDGIEWLFSHSSEKERAAAAPNRPPR